MPTVHRWKHLSNHFQLLFLRHARQLKKSGERIKFTVHPSPQPHEATHTSRASSSAPLRAFWKSSATTAPAAPTATPPTTNNHQAGPEGSSVVCIMPAPVPVLVLVLTASVVTSSSETSVGLKVVVLVTVPVKVLVAVLVAAGGTNFVVVVGISGTNASGLKVTAPTLICPEPEPSTCSVVSSSKPLKSEE